MFAGGVQAGCSGGVGSGGSVPESRHDSLRPKSLGGFLNIRNDFDAQSILAGGVNSSPSQILF